MLAVHAAAQAAGHAAAAKEALDVQVLHGLDTFLATERFLCKLEQARAEWIDLSEHAHHAAAGCTHPPRGGAAATAAAAHAAAAPRAHGLGPASASSSAAGASASDEDDEDWAAAAAPASSDPSSDASASADATAAAHAGGVLEDALAADAAAQAAVAAAVGDFVVINRDDAVEAMAYYIAMYISRLPEAQRMDPKQLQGALKETFAILRRSRWRMVWSWGRLLYRSAAVSFSALQLYQNPWLLRAVLSAIWASSRLLYAQMV